MVQTGYCLIGAGAVEDTGRHGLEPITLGSIKGETLKL